MKLLFFLTSFVNLPLEQKNVIQLQGKIKLTEKQQNIKNSKGKQMNYQSLYLIFIDITRAIPIS